MSGCTCSRPPKDLRSGSSSSLRQEPAVPQPKSISSPGVGVGPRQVAGAQWAIQRGAPRAESCVTRTDRDPRGPPKPMPPVDSTPRLSVPHRGCAAAIARGPRSAPQTRDRGAQGFVVPALDGRAAQHDPRAAEGVAPLLSGEFLELLLQFAAGRGRGQERSDDAEAKMRPAFMRPTGRRLFVHRMPILFWFHRVGGAAPASTPPAAGLSPGILCGR